MIIKKGHTAIIEINEDLVKKIISLNAIIDSKSEARVKDFDLVNREIYWLSKFHHWDHTPIGIDYSEKIILMEYVGEPISPINFPREYKNQCEEILTGLKKYNCSHNDIRPDNVLVKDGKIYLIDFQWATEIGKPIPKHWPEKIGSKFRKGIHNFDDRYSLYKTIEYCHPIKPIIDNLINDKPFAFSRYGDGEWNAILGVKGHNCDHHEYYPDMGKRLKEIVMSIPAYMMGMQNRAKRLMGKEINQLMNGIDIDWINADAFHYASLNGNLHWLFNALKGRKTIMVGPGYLLEIPCSYMTIDDYISIPNKNCWLSHDRILMELRRACEKYKYTNAVFLFCASMMANVLIDELYREFGNIHTFIDAGSVFDPYAGRKTRKYHKTLKI